MIIDNNYSDDDLVRLLQGGDHSAFTLIYHRYWDRLFYKAGKKLNDLTEAESLVQEIFLDLWRRREKLNIRGSLEHYLAGALRYKIIDLQAARQRTAHVPLDAQQLLTAADHSTETSLDYTAFEKQLAGLVARLPEKCRLVFHLRQEGFSQKEIAEKMRISENTVETHIGRALRSLRAGLTHLFFMLF